MIKFHYALGEPDQVMVLGVTDEDIDRWRSTHSASMFNGAKFGYQGHVLVVYRPTKEQIMDFIDKSEAQR